MYKNNNLDIISAPNTPRGRSSSTVQQSINIQVTPDRAATMERIRDKTKAKLACAPVSYPLATINLNLPHISPPSTPKNHSSSSNQQLTSVQVTPDRAATMERIGTRTKARLDEIRLATMLRDKSFAAIADAKKNADDHSDALVFATVQQETANRALINVAEEQAAVEITALMLTLRQEAADRYVIEAVEHQDLVNIDNLMLFNKKEILSRTIIKAAETQDFVNVIYQALANRQEIAKRAVIEAERQYYARNQLTLQFAAKIQEDSNHNLTKSKANNFFRNNSI